MNWHESGIRGPNNPILNFVKKMNILLHILNSVTKKIHGTRIKLAWDDYILSNIKGTVRN